MAAAGKGDAVRRREKEITSRSGIDAVIRSAQVLRLGLVDGMEPYIVPLSFGYDGESLYFHCAPEGRKLDVIRKNDHVCFEVDELLAIVDAGEACTWGARYRSVMGTGRAVILEDRDAKRRGLAAIMAQYSDRTHTFPDREVDRTCVVRVDIGSLSGKRTPA
jgi:hypothetical protein